MPSANHLASTSISKDLLHLVTKLPFPALDDDKMVCAESAELKRWLEDNGGKGQGIALWGDAIDSGSRRGQLLKSGLWLLIGELDRSHEISQNIETKEGSFWHGIMHRREGDYWNSGYWMRKVGRHLVVEQLATECSGYRTPEVFIERVERAVKQQTGDRAELLETQWVEWQLLFAYCLSESV